MSARFWRVFKSRLLNVITHGHVIWHVKCWPKLLLEPGDATKDRHGNGPDATLFRQRSVMSWSRSRIVLRLPTDLQVSIDHSQWLIGQLDNYKCPGRTCVKSMHGICPLPPSPSTKWRKKQPSLEFWSCGVVGLILGLGRFEEFTWLGQSNAANQEMPINEEYMRCPPIESWSWTRSWSSGALKLWSRCPCPCLCRCLDKTNKLKIALKCRKWKTLPFPADFR